MQLKEHLDNWISWLKLTKRFSVHTIIAYRYDLGEFLNFLTRHKNALIDEDQLVTLKITDFRSWLAYRKSKNYSARSTARALSVVRNFYTYLGKESGKICGALSGIQPPRLKANLPKPLTEIQADKLVSDIETFSEEPWIGLRNKALFVLLYATGMRISESLSLTGNHLPLTDRLVILGKGKKQRIIPIIPAVKEAVIEYVKACPYPLLSDTPLFLGARGGKLQPAIAQRTLQQYRQLMGLPDYVTPHALRHSCATHLMAHTKDLRAIQELLGHASLSTTQMYTDIDQQQLLATYTQAHPRNRK